MTPSPRLQDAYVRLSGASSLAGRPGIVVLDEDLPVLKDLTGTRAQSQDIIGALERDGRLRRIRRGAYALADSTGGIRVGLLDAIAALTPKPYLITAGRALQFHDLSDQHFRRVHVLVPTQLRSWSWRGDEVRYARTDKPLRGATTRTRKTAAWVASPERAITDSLGHPQWGVTLGQVVEALEIMLARDPRFADRLADDIAGRGSHTLARRMGFLTSRLAGDDCARVFLPLRGQGKAVTPLDTRMLGPGPIDPVWKVRENVELGRLVQRSEA